MPEKKNSQTGNFLSWLFKKHFLKLEIIFTPTIDKEPKEKTALRENSQSRFVEMPETGIEPVRRVSFAGF